MTPDRQHLSCYILTFNSQKYLEGILTALTGLPDEIIIVDSGSTDNTKSIAEKFGCAFFCHPFKNFREQRLYAISVCRHDMILFLDCDEIPSMALVGKLKRIKQAGFEHDAYDPRRKWFVLGKEIHSLITVTFPDYTTRLINKQTVYYDPQYLVHEQPKGYANKLYLEEWIEHYTFETEQELKEKLEKYSSLAAEQLFLNNKKAGFEKLYLSPLAAWFKNYVVKGGWKDGRVGWILGKYAYNYTSLKYCKLRELTKGKGV